MSEEDWRRRGGGDKNRGGRGREGRQQPAATTAKEALFPACPAFCPAFPASGCRGGRPAISTGRWRGSCPIFHSARWRSHNNASDSISNCWCARGSASAPPTITANAAKAEASSTRRLFRPDLSHVPPRLPKRPRYDSTGRQWRRQRQQSGVWRRWQWRSGGRRSRSSSAVRSCWPSRRIRG